LPQILEKTRAAMFDAEKSEFSRNAGIAQIGGSAVEKQYIFRGKIAAYCPYVSIVLLALKSEFLLG
jgi:hypothetical protein